MITALDQITLDVAEMGPATTAYERLLGREGLTGEETASVFFLDNMRLELSLSETGAQGLAAVTFEVESADAAYRTCQRRALLPEPPVAFLESAAHGVTREGHKITLDRAATFGVATTLVQHATRAAPPERPVSEGAVTGLDHVVIRTTHPNRAAALYGARLGLDMRLDRTEPKWGARLMFFRCGDLIVEVVHNLNEEPSDAADKLWGLSWRVVNADAAHARLKTAGFDISEIRPGRKPGTRVFTVRNNTLGMPTLMVEVAARR